MVDEDKLMELQQELARQDAELAAAAARIESIADVEVEVTLTSLREIEEACVVHVTSWDLPVRGLRV